MSIPVIILFDIDGTLVRTGGAGGRALNIAFARLFEVQEAFQNISFVGSTDLRLVEDVFQIHFGRSPTRDEVEALFQAYLGELEPALEATSYEVNPGVREALALFQGRSQTALGLATGNIEEAATMKLKPGGLDIFFSFGGFGSDAESRTELTRLGAERGCRLLESNPRRTPVVVVGDSIYDIRSAKEIGGISVGVCTGWTDREILGAENPDYLLDDLRNPEKWIGDILNTL